MSATCTHILLVPHKELDGTPAWIIGDVISGTCNYMHNIIQITVNDKCVTCRLSLSFR